jgi:hypothetical protein
MIFGRQKKALQTQIADLAATPVELTEREMRVVSGGFSSTITACAVYAPPSAGFAAPSYGTINDGDHDVELA